MAGFEVGEAGGVVRHVQGAFVLRLAVDAEAVDHGEHFAWGFTQHLVQAAALFLAQGRLDIVGANPGAGVDQADVASGATVADFPGLQQDDRLALLKQVDRRRQAGDTATDDTHIGLVLSGQGLGGDGRFADEFPQAFLTQFGHGRLQQCCSCWGCLAAHRRQADSHSIPWEPACRRNGGKAPACGHQSNTMPCASGSSRE
ncbi:hypothetical protein D3C79_724620 [compost metagenome]